MTPPLSIRGCILDIGKIWDEETAKFEAILRNIPESRLFVIDPKIRKQIDYMSVLKDDDLIIDLTKDDIECDKDVVVFLCQGIVSTSRLVGYQIRTLKATHPSMQFHVIFNPVKSMMFTECLREEKALVDVTMHSLEMYLLPVEEDIISEEISNCFSRMYLKKDRTIVPQILQSIQLLYKKSYCINEIHAIGDRAVELMETIQKQKNVYQKENEGNSTSIRHFILIDRSVDFSSLFVTPLTYEGLIDELCTIDINSTTVDSSVVGGRDDGKRKLMLSDDDYLFSEIRNKNIALLPKSLQDKLYEMNAENAARQGKKLPSKQDSFDQLLVHQGMSEFITNITNNYHFRQKWQMEHEMLQGEQMLDYITERITLQDSLTLILRYLCLYSIINGGLKSKDYDTIRKEIIHTYGYENLLYLYNLEQAGLFVRRDGSKNYSAIRNKLQLVKECDGENESEMHYITSGYAPISIRLIENLLKAGRLTLDITRLLGCDYDHSILKTPKKNEGGKELVVLYFMGGLTYLEIAALRYLESKEDFPYTFIICTTNITNGNKVLEEIKQQPPLKLPVLRSDEEMYTPL